MIQYCIPLEWIVESTENAPQPLPATGLTVYGITLAYFLCRGMSVQPPSRPPRSPHIPHRLPAPLVGVGESIKPIKQFLPCTAPLPWSRAVVNEACRVTPPRPRTPPRTPPRGHPHAPPAYLERLWDPFPRPTCVGHAWVGLGACRGGSRVCTRKNLRK